MNTSYARPAAAAAAAMDMDDDDPPGGTGLRSSQDANAIDAEDRSSLVSDGFSSPSRFPPELFWGA